MAETVLAQTIWVEGFDPEYEGIRRQIVRGMSKGWLQAFEIWEQMGAEEEARKKRAAQLNRLVELSRPRGYLEWLPTE